MPRPPSGPIIAVNATALLACFAIGAALAANGPTAPVPEPAAAVSIVSELGLRVAAEPVRERSGWQPPQEILVAPELHSDLPRLKQVAPQVRFVEFSPGVAAGEFADADAIIGSCDQKILQAAPHAQWIQLLVVGVERCVQQPLILERRPLITNMQRVPGASMAEHVMGMMLILSHHLDYFLRQQARGHWATGADHYPEPGELKGKTVLVVGLGGVGTEVAKRAYAFGMRVTATRASAAAAPDYVSYVGSPDELLKLATDADVIVNCTPLTPQTARLFNRQFFDATKPSAYFINVGRGGSVVTADLIAALRAGRIAGAGLDVTDPEPLPADSALWHMKNVVITPHMSGNSPLSADMGLAVLVENLRRYIGGEPMLSVVDIDRGY
jgi:phosphoglycerate dehydrogenase-like enzyme